jgi:hypothetical protein
LFHPGLFEWHRLHIKFHENIPSGSEVISGGQTDWQFNKLALISGK